MATVRRAQVTILILAGITMQVPGSAEPPQCESEYTVRVGDTLSSIALAHYGRLDAYPRIVEANNASGSDRFPRIADPNRLIPGWLLCIVGAAGVKASIVGPVWRWNRLLGADSLDVATPGNYTLELHPGGRYTIRADCNTGSGSYSLGDDRFEMGPGPMSQAACGGDSLSNRYLQLLSSAQTYRCSGDRLFLKLGGGGGEMEFVARRTVNLAGTSWIVRSYNNGKQAVVSVRGGTSLNALFGADGKLAGSSGCNRFTAGYTVGIDTIEVGPAALTRRMCGAPEGIMEQETAFLTALATAATYKLEGERLQLRTSEGALAVDLVSAVTGTVTYRTRDALPPDALVRVQLLDVSLADAPAKMMTEQAFPTRGKQVPLPFSLVYDPGDIDPRHAYNVRATIHGPDGGLLFTSQQAYPVITRNAPTYDVEVRLDRIP
jgi:uncharacterized lipoprotein YbaY